MKTTTKTPLTDYFKIFSEKQIEAIKLIVRKGFWGDCDQEFGTKVITTNYAHGYYTNMNKGKEFSGIMSGISKVIVSSDTNVISMCSDWWGDGISGDMMFFNMDLIDDKELTEWAESDQNKFDNLSNTLSELRQGLNKCQSLDSKITEIIDQYPMYKSFIKYLNQDQEGKNDYEKGCIQTANALMPVIAELIIELQNKNN